MAKGPHTARPRRCVRASTPHRPPGTRPTSACSTKSSAWDCIGSSSTGEIPIVNHWQHFHKGTYVTGIEPGNCSVLGRAWNRKHGTLQYIEPDEVREFNMEIGVLDGADQMREFERKVEQGLTR